MSAIKWGDPDTATVMLTTQLNSLGNDSLSSLGSVEYDNRTNKYRMADFELVLASLTPTAGGMVLLFLAHALDGTNYPDVKKESAGLKVAEFALDTAASAKRTMVKNVLIPPSKIKMYAHNLAGVSLAASGNTVTMLPYADQIL